MGIKPYKRTSLRKKRHRELMLRRLFLVGVILAVSSVLLLIAGRIFHKLNAKRRLAQEHTKTEQMLETYFSYLNARDYEKMYQMLDEKSRSAISPEEFLSRNQLIYDGIEAKQIEITIQETEDRPENRIVISYDVTMDTVAGELSYSNTAVFTAGSQKTASHALSWDDTMIFPDLSPGDRIRVSVREAKRGRILDRNGIVLAGEGTATQVGIVPGKMRADNAADLSALAALLGMTTESITRRLDAGWVRSDSFVPLKTVEKLNPLEQMSEEPGEKTAEKARRDAALLQIPGVMLSDVTVRQYPLGAAGSHLIGYIQNVTSEDIENHPGERYTENSKIGRSGIESLYEKELRGQDGYEIVLTDAEGEKKRVLAKTRKMDGSDIRLTVDYHLQRIVYDAFVDDKSCTVALNPYTGDVLALVSTPSFDGNDFVLGMSDDLWNSLNEDERKPLYNRFRQKLCPGSTLKPIISAVGLSCGALDPDEDFGDEGLRWQKDESWGNYHVTTLHAYSPVNMENALIYSDNIYFAKAALKIGAEALQEGLDSLGFNEALPFEIPVASSQYSNTEAIESEIQLADSGYGQGQVLANPVHLAALYTGFANGGTILRPRLLYEQDAEPEIWIEGVWQPEHAERIRSALLKVVQSENGTGHGAYREGLSLAAKTGTAEIKQSKEDADGTELGWFCIFTADPATENPLLLLSMAEDVKTRGGSGYVVGKASQILDGWFLPDTIPGAQTTGPVNNPQPEDEIYHSDPNDPNESRP